MRKARRLGLYFLLLYLATPQNCLAWGHEGHRLTALVAEEYLTPATKAQIVELLGNETLADVAPWADGYRGDHPETGKWHYVDIPKAEKFDRSRDCPVSEKDPKSPWRDCVTDRILFFEGRLGDTSLSEADRAMALKFVVHLIGDIHQPFHAYGDDRGGNNIRVTFLGSPRCGNYACNLHSVWDDSILENQGLSEKKYTERLLQEIKDNNWERLSGGEPTTWANISHHYAVEAVAPDGALITHEYVVEESKIVDAQLALGGLRLARALNRILGETPQDTQPGRELLPKPEGTADSPKN
ncbi:MAG TPA: S1/P1 nuclease [Acidobacteriaceae bacterium]